MEIIRFIFSKFFYIWGELLKFQRNWFLEAFVLVIIALLFYFFIWWGIKLTKYKRSNQQTKRFKKLWQNTWYSAAIAINVAFLTAFSLHVIFVIYIAVSDTHKLSDFSFDEQLLQNETANVFIHDQKGNNVYKVVHNSKNRDIVSINEMPSYLTDAFVDIEDKSFYYHTGISFTGYLRSGVRKLFHPEERMHGGSTITQQLIKNVNEDMNNRTLLHKWQEAALSWVIESKYNKDEILEMYMNRIYLGNGVYGVGTAAKQFFHKEIYDLTLVESAFLAGLPQAPETYMNDLNAGNHRKNLVLKAMKDNGTITENQYEKAVQQHITFVHKPVKQVSTSLDAYVDYVLKEAKQDYSITDRDLQTNGYHIYTYLDTDFQHHMYNTAQSFSYPDDRDNGKNRVQAGIAAVDNNSHKIIALYGGRDFIRGYLNRSYQYYQPGSILKPLAVYGPAFETGKWDGQSIVKDEKTDFNGYAPNNALNVYEGDITVERALIRSANIPAVTVFQDIGVNKGVKALKKMGIEIYKEDKQLHLALGGMEKGVTPIQMAQAYSVFPNFGYFQPAKAIKFIKDKDGNIVRQKRNAEVNGVDVFSSENAYHMTEILQKVISHPNGTGKNAQIGVPAAGKTGSTEEPNTNDVGIRDAWFVGYTPNITMAVHVGFDQPSATNYLTTSGGGLPTKLYANIMKYRAVASEFQKPSKVKEIEEKEWAETKKEKEKEKISEIGEFFTSAGNDLEQFVSKLKGEFSTTVNSLDD